MACFIPMRAKRACKPYLREVVDRVCIGQYIPPFNSTKKFRYFNPQTTLKYEAFCDDFGPMNLSSIISFIEQLDIQLRSFPSSRIVYAVVNGRRELTNAIFLLGAYLILRREYTSSQVLDVFHWLSESLIESYRDATYSSPDFGLTLEDCWRGLERGKASSWLNHPALPESARWGMIDIDEYAHWGNPHNGDLHMVVPGKFIAFQGPKDLGPQAFSDELGYRRFSPSYYADILRGQGVTDVVRLNEAEYDGGDFVARGIRHHDLCFDDCTAPPARVVRRFLDIVDGAAGVVAVHCKAGLGRTGTLIALALMRSHGFSAREAMGWLRIMRPGSVIGEQQHYLCAVERGDDGIDDCDGALWGGRSSPAALAAQVAGAVERRCCIPACCDDTPADCCLRSAPTGSSSPTAAPFHFPDPSRWVVSPELPELGGLCL